VLFYLEVIKDNLIDFMIRNDINKI